MYFFSTFMPEWMVPVTVSLGTEMLRYRYGVVRNQQSYLYTAMLKVPNGLRYTMGNSREVPTIHAMTDACLRSGDFALRPYVLGQDSDLCSDDCLFGLVRDCCDHFKSDIVDLLRHAYPESDSMSTRVSLVWAFTKCRADWQGTQFPRRWTADALTGLALSLHNHYRPKLMQALLDAIGQS
jgi:hypothetical protein